MGFQTVLGGRPHHPDGDGGKYQKEKDQAGHTSIDIGKYLLHRSSPMDTGFSEDTSVTVAGTVFGAAAWVTSAS